MSGKTVVVGLGSFHGDDRAGWEVVERVARQDNSGYFCKCLRSPAELLDVLEGVHRLVICDACENAGSPGLIRLWQWPSDELGCRRASSSHDLPLASALILAEQLRRLPETVTIWGIEGASFKPCSEMCAGVRVAVEQVAGEIARIDSIDTMVRWHGDTSFNR